MVPALVVPGWGHAPQGECGEQAQEVLDCGGVLEVWSVELTQPVLAGCLFSPCKCRALAQDALGCADSPETQYGEPAQDILVQGDILETRTAEPGPSFLAGCPF